MTTIEPPIKCRKRGKQAKWKLPPFTTPEGTVTCIYRDGALHFRIKHQRKVEKLTLIQAFDNARGQLPLL